MTSMVTIPDYEANLSPLQLRVLRILLTRGTIRQAVAITGISKTTMYRYLADENFSNALKLHMRALLDSTTRGLIQVSEDCIALLTRVVNDESKPLALRLRAVDTALTHVTRLIALSDFEHRLQLLESLSEGEYAEPSDTITQFREAEKIA